MVQRRGGFRRKSRQKMAKLRSNKGKISIRNYLQEFSMHDKVYLTMEPAVQNGQYNLRFYSAHGEIVGKKGACYEVQIKHLNATRRVIVHPVHLKKVIT